MIVFLAVVVGGLLFLGGKREKRAETHAYTAEEQESIAGGNAVDTGTFNPTPPRTSGRGDD